MVPGMYSSSAGDLNNTSWLGPSSGSSLLPWAQLKCFLCLFFRQQVVAYCLHVNWSGGLTMALEGPVMEYLLGRRDVGSNQC